MCKIILWKTIDDFQEFVEKKERIWKRRPAGVR